MSPTALALGKESLRLSGGSTRASVHEGLKWVEKDAVQVCSHLKAACMKAACAAAEVGVISMHGGPFGAAVVSPDGILLSAAHNCVLKNKDPSCHGEVMAIRQALGLPASPSPHTPPSVPHLADKLKGCDLYTSCEPCPMCWGCIRLAGIRTVYVGADRHTAAEFGFDDSEFYRDLCQRDWKSLELIEFNCLDSHRVAESLRSLDGSGSSSPTSTVEFSQVTSPPSDDVFLQLVELARSSGCSDSRSSALIVDGDGKCVFSAASGLSGLQPVDGAILLAVRGACSKLDSYSLKGCSLLTLKPPSVFEMGLLLWARVDRVYAGVSWESLPEEEREEAMRAKGDLESCGGGITSSSSGGPSYEGGVGVEGCVEVFRTWQKVNSIIY